MATATAFKQELDPTTQRAPAPEKPSRRRIVLPIVLVLALLGATWAFKQWSYGRAHESTDDAAIDGHLVPVDDNHDLIHRWFLGVADLSN